MSQPRSPISQLADAGIGFDGSPLPGRETPKPAGQSRGHSLVETIVGTVVGFFVSTAINMLIVPLILHTHVSMSDNLTLTAIFTVASILRGYYVRRWFNRKVAP